MPHLSLKKRYICDHPMKFEIGRGQIPYAFNWVIVAPKAQLRITMRIHWGFSLKTILEHRPNFGFVQRMIWRILFRGFLRSMQAVVTRKTNSPQRRKLMVNVDWAFINLPVAGHRTRRFPAHFGDDLQSVRSVVLRVPPFSPRIFRFSSFCSLNLILDSFKLSSAWTKMER